MFMSTLKGLAADVRRLFTTALAVLLGVAFTAGTLVLTDTLRGSFDAMHADANAGVDLYVRRAAAFGDGIGAGRDRVDAATLEAIAATDGVAEAAGRLRGYAQFVDADGNVVGDLATGMETYGENWVTPGPLSAWRLVDGEPPVAHTDVVVDLATSRTLGVIPGDSVEVLARGGQHTMTVSGLATFGEADAMFGATSALFADATAQALLGDPDRYDGIALALAEGADPAAVQARLEATLTGHEVLTGSTLTAEEQAATRAEWAFFDTFLLTIAAVALLVGGFIIFNTFSITVAQRTRQFAVLRSLGASRRQVLGSVVLESSVVGLAGSLAGVAAGVGVAAGLRRLIGAFGIELPAGGATVEARSLLVALAVGLVVTVGSSVVPAIRASRVAPVAAMRETAIDTSAGSRTRAVIGLTLTASGAIAMALGLAGVGGQPIGLVGLGALGVFLGVAALGPVVVRPVAHILGRPIRRARGVTGDLATQNAVRSPKRTAATASALMIGVALVGFITILAASVKASIDEMVAGGVRADFVVESGTFDFGGLDRSLGAALRELPEVTAVSGISWTPGLVDGAVVDVVGMDTGAIQQLLDLPDVAGSLSGDGGQGLGLGELAISADEAAARGWTVGTRVPVVFADGVERTMTVASVFTDDVIGVGVLADSRLLDGVERNRFDVQVLVGVDERVSREQAAAAITAVTDRYANATVYDREQFARAQAAQVDPILGLIYALLAFAVLIAALGIANTLALSIFERTSELGTLRAIGMSRAQLRATVRWESVLIAAFGTLLGLLIGVGFGWAVVDALAAEGVRVLSVPAAQLAVIAALAALAGVAAAVLPARRAARIDVLDALAA